MRFKSTASQSHERAEHLIPWLVNGTLEPQATRWLRTHLEACESCRADFEEQRQVYEAMHAEGPLLFAAEPSFHKLLSRIRSGREEPLSARSRGIGRGGRRQSAPWELPPARAGALVRWVAAAAIIEALALGVGVYFWPSSSRAHSPEYVTLTSPAPSFRAGEQARVVFKNDLSLGELQTLLHSVDAHIIDGPTYAGVYTLGFPAQIDAAMVHERIVALRARASVLFAEPISADGSR
jgi:anti-sigma factor RsiW